VVLSQSITPSQLPDRVFKRQGSFRGAPRYVEIGIPEPEQLPCEVFVKDGDTFVAVKVVSEPEWANETGLPPIDDAVQAKRERLAAMQSAAFHYLDAAAVREAYAQEMAAAASSRGAKAGAMDEPWLYRQNADTTPPVADSGAGHDAEAATGEPTRTGELPPEAMLLAYQRQLITSDAVMLDLEFENRKPEELVQFDRVMRWLKTKYPKALAPEAAIRRIRQQIAREETGKQMDRLRAGGRAIIHAAFAVEHPKPDVVRLSLFCPGTHAFPEALRIEINLRADRIAESWRDQYAMESTMTAYVMGTPLNWQKQQVGEEDSAQEVWVVALKPFAIYS
jgi:hypothetical protein